MRKSRHKPVRKVQSFSEDATHAATFMITNQSVRKERVALVGFDRSARLPTQALLEHPEFLIDSYFGREAVEVIDRAVSGEDRVFLHMDVICKRS